MCTLNSDDYYLPISLILYYQYSYFLAFNIRSGVTHMCSSTLMIIYILDLVIKTSKIGFYTHKLLNKPYYWK